MPFNPIHQFTNLTSKINNLNKLNHKTCPTLSNDNSIGSRPIDVPVSTGLSPFESTYLLSSINEAYAQLLARQSYWPSNECKLQNNPISKYPLSSNLKFENLIKYWLANDKIHSMTQLSKNQELHNLKPESKSIPLFASGDPNSNEFSWFNWLKLMDYPKSTGFWSNPNSVPKTQSGLGSVFFNVFNSVFATNKQNQSNESLKMFSMPTKMDESALNHVIQSINLHNILSNHNSNNLKNNDDNNKCTNVLNLTYKTKNNSLQHPMKINIDVDNDHSVGCDSKYKNASNQSEIKSGFNSITSIMTTYNNNNSSSSNSSLCFSDSTLNFHLTNGEGIEDVVDNDKEMINENNPTKITESVDYLSIPANYNHINGKFYSFKSISDRKNQNVLSIDKILNDDLKSCHSNLNKNEEFRSSNSNEKPKPIRHDLSPIFNPFLIQSVLNRHLDPNNRQTV